MAKNSTKITVETLTHDEATRKNIPTAEYRSVIAKELDSPIRVAYERRNRVSFFTLFCPIAFALF